MDLSLVINSLPQLLSGLPVSVEISALALVIGLALAIPLALLRVSRNPLVRAPVFGFIFYFRGTPLLVQLFLIYYGSGQFRTELEALGLWTFFREAYFCAVLTLTLNTAAYTAAILRGAIQAVPHGEIEAGRATGRSRTRLQSRIA